MILCCKHKINCHSDVIYMNNMFWMYIVFKLIYGNKMTGYSCFCYTPLLYVFTTNNLWLKELKILLQKIYITIKYDGWGFN